ERRYAFAIKISKNKTVSKLKKLIKAELSNHFARIDYNQLRLWKVKILDDSYEKLANLTLQD
ncbi:13368_t:CDS:1, partial [Entrophospora sp. SA101]